MRINMNNPLQFSILDFLNEADRKRLTSKAKYVYSEVGRFVEVSPNPDTLYIVTHGLLSLRSKVSTHFEFGRCIIGRSLEMKTLFNNSKTWEFAWCALEPTTVMAIPWKDFRECLAKDKATELYLRRISISVELQRLVRDLRAFACSQTTIFEIVTKFVWYKDKDLVLKIKQGGSYFIVVSSGCVELLADAEGKQIAFASVQNGQHFNLKLLPSMTLRLHEGTSAFVMSSGEWQTLKCLSEFEFFLSLHAGLSYKDTSDKKPVSIFKSPELDQTITIQRKPFFWFSHPIASIRAFWGKRYLVWAPDDTWLKDSCLSTLARLHGQNLPLETTRHEFLSLQDGEILSSIRKVGRILGYNLEISRPKILNQAPAIINYQNKPIVVLNCNANFVEVGDTYSLQTRLVSMKRLKLGWSGEVLTWGGKRATNSIFVSAPVLQYFRLLKGSRRSLFLLLCAGLISTFFTIVGLLLAQFIFERIPHETNNEVVYMVLGGYVFCLVLASSISWIERNVRSRLQWSLAAKVNSAYLNHIMRIPLVAFDSLNKGELFNRLNDAKSLSDFLSSEVIKVFINLSSLILCGSILYLFHPMLCSVLLAVLPFIALVTWILPSKIKEANLRSSQAKAVIKGRAISALENLETVISNNALRSERWRIEASMFRELTIKNQLIRFSIFQEALIAVLTAATKLGGLYLGVILFMRHQISMGMVVGTPFLIERAIEPLIQIFALINRLPSYAATVQRLHSVFGISSEKLEVSESTTRTTRGDIKFKNVDFSFYKGGQKILKRENLHFKPGEVVAIAGDSGCGKTTLVNLINRLREPTGGEIFLDDENIENIPLSQLRSAIGCLPQSGGVMRGTIAENISMFDKKATLEKVERAARIACAHDMISSLTQGYSTMIDTSGTGLSEGQSHLVCIARLVYADPEVFILDESTAHIDAITEELIYKSLLSTFKGRTFIIVSQKLNVLLKADRIIYVKAGKALEVGSHAQLIKSQGPYFEYVCKQVCVNV